MVEAPRDEGLPRRLIAYYRLPSIEHVANVTVAGTPPQFVASYRALIAAGLRSFVVSPSGDPETLRLLADAVVPQLGTADRDGRAPEAGTPVSDTAPSRAD